MMKVHPHLNRPKVNPASANVVMPMLPRVNDPLMYHRMCMIEWSLSWPVEYFPGQHYSNAPCID